MNRYACVFFDLDHTLWDYDKNCAETLYDLYHRYQLQQLGIDSFQSFLDTFVRINTDLWDRYDRGLLHRDIIRFQRFHNILMALGLDNYTMSLQLSGDYIQESPMKKNLMPHALETLDYLAASYPMFIITNGFDEIQSIKVSSAGIEKYFKKIVTSEMAGHKKPAREIFDYALRQNGFQPQQAIMIGDNLLTDIAGAKNAGLDHIFFNPGKILHKEPVTFEIAHLGELKSIL